MTGTESALSKLREWVPGLRRVVLYRATPPRLVLEMDGGQVSLGQSMPSVAQIRWAIFLATGVMPAPVPREKVDALLTLLAQAAVLMDAPEAEELDALRLWVEIYLERKPPVSEEDERNYLLAHRYEDPLEIGGDIYINTTNLATWLAGRGVKISARELALLLRRYGAEAERVQVWDGGRARHRRYWRLPSSILPRSMGSDSQGEGFSPSGTDSSHIATCVDTSGYAKNAVQDGAEEGSSHIATSPGEGTKTSGYVARSGISPVQNGANGPSHIFDLSGYVARSDEDGLSPDFPGKDSQADDWWEVL